MRTPSVWPLALVPVLIALLVTVALGSGATAFLVPRIASLFGARWTSLAVVAEGVVGVAAFVVGWLVSLGIAQPLSGPALNRLVRRAEVDLGKGSWQATGLLEDMGRALQSMLVGYAVGLPPLLVLSLLAVVPAAEIVIFPLKLVVLAVLFAWDFCDYPLSCHGVPVGRRVALVARNLLAMLGFGFGLALLSLVPCAGLLVLPVGVAGATRLIRRIERSEGALHR